jgi:hypothetical protein
MDAEVVTSPKLPLIEVMALYSIAKCPSRFKHHQQDEIPNYQILTAEKNTFYLSNMDGNLSTVGVFSK